MAKNRDPNDPTRSERTIYNIRADYRKTDQNFRERLGSMLSEELSQRVDKVIEARFKDQKKKEAVLDVMHKNSISANDILFIGDSVKDMEAANKSGAFFVGRKNKENLEEYNVLLFDDLNQIKQYIEKSQGIENERV